MAPPRGLVLFCLALVLRILVASAADPPIIPSPEQGRTNAYPIFNSIHSATRQWGSSLNHNGMAMIPAKVPKGTLLYHGTHSSDVRTTSLEWLAFEPEHSEVFCTSWHSLHRTQTAKQSKKVVSDQAVLHGSDKWQQQSDSLESTKTPAVRGYLRTYQANRDLNLLYLDGMSAGKGCIGPMDTQDLIIRMINGTSPCDSLAADIIEYDVKRVGEICDVLTPLGYDGILRMEAGFETVYCDFSDGGLHLLSQMRRPFWDEMKAWYPIQRLVFHMARAATQHYNGMVGAFQVQLDFSRMVSAYFYPINATKTEVVADKQARGRLLPRLSSTTNHERQAIRRRVQEVAVRRDRPGIDWQSVVDAIVSRYADRLNMLSSLSPARLHADASRFAAEIFVATNTYVNFPSTKDDVTAMMMEAEVVAHRRCRTHYLQSLEATRSSFTPEDHLIYAAITEVTGSICGALFQARSHLRDAYQSELHEEESRGVKLARAAETSQQKFRSLVSDLQWTQWERCSGCAVDELCFLPMFPFGSLADGHGPRCLNETGLDQGLSLSNNYWGMDVRGAMKYVTEPF